MFPLTLAFEASIQNLANRTDGTANQNGSASRALCLRSPSDPHSRNDVPVQRSLRSAGPHAMRANIRCWALTPAQSGDTDKCETHARTHCCSTQEAFIQTPSNSHRRRSAAPSFGSYLVDPASSHMLVSKIKPCMSKYKYCTAKLQTAH